MKNLKRLLTAAISVFGLASFTADAAFINFNDYTTSGFSTQFKTGNATSSADGTTLTLSGNLWVSLSEMFSITSDSTLKFTMEASGTEAEWYGIGFDNDNRVTANTLFQLGGNEGTRANQISSYNFGDGAVDFSIDVGSTFTGVFDRIVFILDADSMSGASLSFSNVQLCNNSSPCLLTNELQSVTAVNAPGAGALLFLSLFALFVRRR
ncbi:hypothetical protein [Alteromonas genovensis]|uniref:hypothetical protein n=1 Tax=Alteromonas genovensis TaxID=471225 RepID=UPI002FE217B8